MARRAVPRILDALGLLALLGAAVHGARLPGTAVHGGAGAPDHARLGLWASFPALPEDADLVTQETRLELSGFGRDDLPYKNLIFNIINTGNHTAAITLMDQAIITGEWQPEPPQAIPFWGSGHTPSGSMVIGAKAAQQGDTLVNATQMYHYEDQKTLLVAGVMVDSFGAAILTGWSRGTDARTYLTVVGEELVATVVYGDCGPSGGPSCP